MREAVVMRQDAKEWLTQALADANTYDLPYIARWPDGTYSALSKREISKLAGDYRAVVSVELVRASLEKGEQVHF
jgi:hypothetical protein